MLKSLGFVRHPDKKLAAPLVGGGRRRWCSGVCFTGGVWGGYPSGSSLVVSSWWGKEEARRWHWGVRVSQDAGRRHEDHGVVLAVFGDEQFGVPVQFTA